MIFRVVWCIFKEGVFSLGLRKVLLLMLLRISEIWLDASRR